METFGRRLFDPSVVHVLSISTVGKRQYAAVFFRLATGAAAAASVSICGKVLSSLALSRRTYLAHEGEQRPSQKKCQQQQ